MTEYLYQIKAKNPQPDEDSYFSDSWAWPPVMTGKVVADDKKAARAKLEEEFSVPLPGRVAKKNMASAEFLLHLREIKEGDDRTQGLFEFRKCLECDKSFRVIDLYNDHCEKYKGHDYCSWLCKEAQKGRLAVDTSISAAFGTVIYRIHNKKTLKSYIGRTSQAFTLRWWQHFAHPSGTPFHDAIKESCIEDWTFEVLERVGAGECPAKREQFHIDQHDAQGNGYNTAIAVKNANQTEMEGF